MVNREPARSTRPFTFRRSLAGSMVLAAALLRPPVSFSQQTPSPAPPLTLQSALARALHRSIGGDRCQPLVVQLDGHVQCSCQQFCLGPGLTGGRPVAPVE